MKSKLLITLFLVLLVSCSESTLSDRSSKDWQLVWSDEFSVVGVPDTSKWEFDVEGNAWDWGNNEDQNYTPAENKNAWVENGTLIIEARKENYTAPEDNETKEYTSARLRTRNRGDWTYGKIEVSAKLPGGKGSWPAIWMLSTPEPYGGWPKSGEIDIMENIGSEPTTIYVNAWNEGNESTDGTGGTVEVDSIYTNFHLYGLEWDSTELRFFVDGVQVHRYQKLGDATQWPYNHPFHLLLNLAIGGDWEGAADPAIFPIRMEVDYVRVYQK